MEGYGPDFTLKQFIGRELTSIGLGRFQFDLEFSGIGGLSIKGRWELRDPEGALLDEEVDHDEREAYRVHRLLELTLTKIESPDRDAATLVFEPAYRLTIFDEPGYEVMVVWLDGDPTIRVI